jgi:hypothetical protein
MYPGLNLSPMTETPPPPPSIHLLSLALYLYHVQIRSYEKGSKIASHKTNCKL